jgi:ubiquinone/menaquinone biosynthesis C-methylase UbiE
MSGVTVDWGAGHYERTADDLQPVAADVVARARIQPAERVLDVACGTGNAALQAARDGATTWGVDLAPRLIEVARERARTALLSVHFDVGDAQALPYGDASFEAVTSVFGVIFALDPQRAYTEIVRVLALGGRALITAWTPEGAIAAMSGSFARAVAEATNAPAVNRFAWHEAGPITALAAETGSTATFLADGQITFTAASAEDYLRRYEDLHPTSQAERPILELAGTYDTVRPQVLKILTDGNESSDGFAVTSRYRVIRIQH